MVKEDSGYVCTVLFGQETVADYPKGLFDPVMSVVTDNHRCR